MDIIVEKETEGATVRLQNFDITVRIHREWHGMGWVLL